MQTTGGLIGGQPGTPSHQADVMRWARRWPFATAVAIGLAVWFAAMAILDSVIAVAEPASGMAAFGLGVTVGTAVAGLEGTRRWVVVPVMTLAAGLILTGALVIAGVQLP